MSPGDIRQDRPYRRGLVLGLTLAEIMILLMFLLLMSLASALLVRDNQIKAFEDGTASKMIEVIQSAYPNAKSPEEYFKELVSALEAHKILKKYEDKNLDSKLIEDAKLGRIAREIAEKNGAADPYDFVERVIASAAKGKKGEWPPFFSLSEAGGYYFESGRATLRPDFEKKLREEIIPLLKKNIDDYGVDVVEVIGHTDEVPMSGNSNLDQYLISATDNKVPISRLRSTDNAGLAIARAVAVVSILKADNRLLGTSILPLSGAQMIIPVDKIADGTANTSDQLRRRIEIRLRRSSEQVAQGQTQWIQ